MLSSLHRLRHLFRSRAAPPPAPTLILLPAALRAPLTPAQRQELREWLAQPTTRLALSLVEARHPGLATARISKLARNADDAYGAVFLLNRIAGWESYRDTLLTLAEPAPAATPALEETYPSQ